MRSSVGRAIIINLRILLSNVCGNSRTKHNTLKETLTFVV